MSVQPMPQHWHARASWTAKERRRAWLRAMVKVYAVDHQQRYGQSGGAGMGAAERLAAADAERCAAHNWRGWLNHNPMEPAA